MRTRLVENVQWHWRWPDGADFHDAYFFADGVEVDGVRMPFAGPPMSARLAETGEGALGLELRVCLMPGHEQHIVLPIPPGRLEEAQEVRRFVNERGLGQT